MKLVDLLPADLVTDAHGAAIEVGGINADSRAVKRGDAFVAVAGSKDDGLRFVDQALAAGAAAVMAERAPATPLPGGIGFIKVLNARRALALAAAKFYPRQPAVIAAVTAGSCTPATYGVSCMFSTIRPSKPARASSRASSAARRAISPTASLAPGDDGSAATWIMPINGLGRPNIDASNWFAAMPQCTGGVTARLLRSVAASRGSIHRSPGRRRTGAR